MMHVALCFTDGVSLKTWHSVGMFAREVALYQQLQDEGVQVTFVTYGSKTDFELQDAIAGTHLLVNQYGLPRCLYRLLLPRLFATALANVDLIKTNQVLGSEPAMRLARRLDKPLIARCGYLYSDFMERRHGADSSQASAAKALEDRLYRSATHGVVTTDSMREELLRRQPSLANRLTVIPNYVQTDRFRPMPKVERDIDILFIGRLGPQKNVASLLNAIEELPKVRIALVGNGPLEKDLRDQAARIADRVSWLGRLPNEDLPTLLNRARLYILPSHYEGHPKTLIEAMSCGCAVLGADSPGIRNVIDHGRTGWLCEPTANGIREALCTLLGDETLLNTLRQNARCDAVKKYSLDHIIDLEMAVYEKVLRC